jgi:hypothetical protein
MFIGIKVSIFPSRFLLYLLRQVLHIDWALRVSSQPS